ncbi:hypothetical protein BT63DRAFT_394111 [Microthyrium microscopicum]|uniref:Mmc1 C-terminal domain-containing protein n=1 Tax=Microthyrium microscopicum TaxID=703497 RepID=A0A6A6TVB1_9PEZI|nr:hypothetical protein BT63DRAFT_394111 [Microthyrium microscopicum]
MRPARLTRVGASSIGLSRPSSGFVCTLCSLQTSDSSRRQSNLSPHNATSRLYSRRLNTALRIDVLVKAKSSNVPFRYESHYGTTSTASLARANATSSVTPTPLPTTSVNAPSPIRSSARGLYDSLRELESGAASFVDLGRIKLALRSLEGDGTIRIGILALTRDDAGTAESIQKARKVASCLLADVLAPKSKWEEALSNSGDDARAVIIRYGPDIESPYTNSVFKILQSDSPLLKQFNLEILISTLNVNTTSVNSSNLSSSTEISSLDAILALRLESPASAAGGYSSVEYPIHKALLVGAGLNDILSLGTFTGLQNITTLPSDMIQTVIDVPSHLSTSSGHSGVGDNDSVAIIDVNSSTKAISDFRESPLKAGDYPVEWEASHLPKVLDWVTRDAQSTPKLKAPIKRHIESILQTTAARIAQAESDLESNMQAGIVPKPVRMSISKTVDSWAERAHSELQGRLDVAFNSKQWHKLAWWKLLWRVDEVGMIAGDLLRKSWLVEAEKGTIFVAGRVQEAGLLERKSWELESQAASVIASQSAEDLQAKATDQLGVSPPTSAILYSGSELDIAMSRFSTLDIPYPQHIPSTRQSLLRDTVPRLHARAQSLVFASLSMTGFTSALSALLYISFPSTTLFEASAIAAFGLVLSMSRTQKKWGEARTEWQSTVREQGRQALMNTEGSVRKLVAEGAKPNPDLVLINEVNGAKKLVAKCYDSLCRMGE